MRANKFYNSINSLYCEYDCCSITLTKWDKLMEGAIRANKYIINRLLKEFCPEHFVSFGFDIKPLKDLGWFNPYNYYRTKTHIIVVHSGIEYFYKINCL
jgi:hypothetical protein